MNSNSQEVVPGSFRDPSGYLFLEDGVLSRRVRSSYREHYEHLIASGLYGLLTDRGMLVEHEEVGAPADASDAFLDIRPVPIRFISYPYEWSFSQLQDAALLTLDIQKEALAHGMTMKDASAYNVQFQHGRPVMIDTLSFEKYENGRPWVAYKQFCEHFLAPLALMSRRDVRLSQMLRSHIDGIPLDLARKLLPRRTYLSPGFLLHIHLHAWSIARYSRGGAKNTAGQGRGVDKKGLLGIVSSLEKTVRKLKWAPKGTEWVDYYSATHNYTGSAFEQKGKLVADFIRRVAPATVWDVGSNIGYFSRVAAGAGASVISFDIDPACVELNYLGVRDKAETDVLPLLLDLTNPSPAIGWENREREEILDRPKPNLLLALAVVHHLAISNNVPLERISSYFARIAPHLVIEFVPKSDSQVQHLLASREDVFPSYTQEGFEAAFGCHWSIEGAEPITGSERHVYLMRRRGHA